MSRVLRLTLLAPEIVETILDGRQPEAMRLDDLLSGVPEDRTKQAGLGDRLDVPLGQMPSLVQRAPRGGVEPM